MVAAASAPVPQTWRIFGLFVVDDSPDEGRSGVPRAALQLKVHAFRPSGKPPGRGEKKYLELSWETIKRDARGAYGMGPGLKKRIGKRAALTGVVYDRCGQGLYLRPADDADAKCLFPDAAGHVELLDRDGRPFMKIDPNPQR